MKGKRGLAQEESSRQGQSSTISKLNQLSPSRPPEGDRDPNLIAFKKVIGPKVKREVILKNRQGETAETKGWGKRGKTKAYMHHGPS